MWSIIAQAPGVIPDDYRALDDWRIWAGIVFVMAVSLSLILIRLWRYHGRRHERQTDAHDVMDLEGRKRRDQIELDRLAHQESREERMERELREVRDARIEDMQRELLEEKAKSERLLNRILAQEKAQELVTSPDIFDQQKGRMIQRGIEVELADDGGLGDSGIRRIEEMSEVQISEAQDDDDRRTAWKTTKKKRG